MIKVDKRMLVHSFDYKEIEGKDRNHQPTYKPTQTVIHCRIDTTDGYSRDKAQKENNTQAVIFCYATYTKPFIEFKRQSLVTIDGETYTINKVIPLTDPYKSTLFAYELEVV